MTALSLSAVIALADGKPLDPVRIARLLDAFTRAVERHGCEWTWATKEATQEAEQK